MGRIDLESYTPMPWLKNTARFAANIFVDDAPHPFCPRTNLIRVLQEMQQDGFRLNVGMEPEFFLVTRSCDGSIAPWDPDGVDTLTKPCHDFRGLAPAMPLLQELTTGWNGLGWTGCQGFPSGRPVIREAPTRRHDLAAWLAPTYG